MLSTMIFNFLLRKVNRALRSTVLTPKDEHVYRTVAENIERKFHQGIYSLLVSHFMLKMLVEDIKAHNKFDDNFDIFKVMGKKNYGELQS